MHLIAKKCFKKQDYYSAFVCYKEALDILEHAGEKFVASQSYKDVQAEFGTALARLGERDQECIIKLYSEMTR